MESSSVTLAAVKSNRDRLINLLDLQSLRLELEGRPVLLPFLQTIKTSSGSSERDVRRLLDFVCSSGPQAVAALSGALEAEKTHLGHAEAHEILLQSSSAGGDDDDGTVVASADEEMDAVMSREIVSVLQKAVAELAEKINFDALIPLFLRRGLMTQDQFMSLQATYISASEKAQTLIQSLEQHGIKGVVDFLSMLQTVPSSETHDSAIVTEEIKAKIQESISERRDSLSEDNVDMLVKAGILTPSQSTNSAMDSSSESTTPQSMPAINIKRKDRVAVIISMETYYDKTDVNRKTPVRLSNGQLVVERRNELERLFEELGCVVINISDNLASSDPSNPSVFRELFISKIAGQCSKNTTVFVCILGLVYIIEGEGGALLVKDRPAIPHKSQCITERQLAAGVLSLPTPYVTVVIEGIIDKQQDIKLHSSYKDSLWQSLCPWNSRTIVFSTQLSPDSKEEFEQNELDLGMMSKIIINALRRRKDSIDTVPTKLTHLDLFHIISAQWNLLSLTTPCIRGDVDRFIFGSDNVPLPYHFMGTVTAEDSCKVLLMVGSLSGLVEGETVKLKHVFMPEMMFNGVVSQANPCTSTVDVSDKDGWNALLADIKQNDLEGSNDHGSFVRVIRTPAEARRFCVIMQVSSSSQDELLVFLNTSVVFEERFNDAIYIDERNNEFNVSNKNIKAVRPVASLQLAKSLLIATSGTFAIEEKLLSVDGWKERAFQIHSSKFNCPPENALCEFEENKCWSPDLSHPNVYIGVTFPRNVLLRSVEVRGCASAPRCIPAGYNVSYRTRVTLCDDNGRARKRFEAPSRSKRQVSIKLQCTGQLNPNEILPVCTGPFTVTITPLANGGHKRSVLALRFIQATDKGEAVSMVYQLERNYGMIGFSFNYQPSAEQGIITLPSPEEWLVISYPLTYSDPFSLLVPPGMKLSMLQLHTPPEGLMSTDQFEYPRMIEVELNTPLTTLSPHGFPPTIRCSSFLPEKMTLPQILPCCEVILHPVPPPNPTNQFLQPVCLQLQLHGYDDIAEMEVFDKDLLQAVVNHSCTHTLYLVILCIEDTGRVEIIDTSTVHPTKEAIINYHRLIRAFIPEGFSDVKDEYLVVISSSPLHVQTLRQNGGANYYSTCCYDRQLMEPVQRVTEVQEWWYSYRYKVKVKRRTKTDY